MQYPPITKEVVEILVEVFATAILRTQDETGDFTQAVLDLVEEFGLTDEVSDCMTELVRRAKEEKW